ncbi:MAG TPA: FTR1 family protein [Lacunisphaera sp.]|nr:FTR1 family protein [Lacunisphaera sp.]
MWPSFLLALREGVEAALVVGIVLGVLRKLERVDCTRIVWLGVVSGGLFSLAVALALRALGLELRGPAEPIGEGATLFMAAGLLTWMVAWMNRQARHARGAMEARVRRAVCSPGIGGVFGLTFIAVAREGTELALFLTAVAFDSSAAQTTTGALLGLAGAAGLAWLLFATTTRLNLARFFQVTTALLILFAAGLVAKGVREFIEVGWIPALVHPVWNTRHLLDEHSPLGTAAKTLLGYTSTPSLAVVIGYVSYLAAAITWLRAGARPSQPTAPRSRFESLAIDDATQHRELKARS